MKLSIFLCSAILLFSVPATAQERSTFHFLLNGGLSLPQNPDEFKDGWRNGFSVGGGISYRFSRHITVQGLVNYDRFSFDEEAIFDLIREEIGFDPRELGISFDVQGAEFTALSVSGELKVSFVGDPNKVSPYAIGGGGLARLSLGDTTISGSFMGIDLTETVEGESETEAMATFGGGVDIPLGERAVVFVEGRYQLNFTEDERTDFASFRGGVRIGL